MTSLHNLFLRSLSLKVTNMEVSFKKLKLLPTFDHFTVNSINDINCNPKYLCNTALSRATGRMSTVTFHSSQGP